MDVGKHLTSKRPSGHGWTQADLEAVKGYPLDRIHIADHKALGKFAGHTHEGTK